MPAAASVLRHKEAPPLHQGGGLTEDDLAIIGAVVASFSWLLVLFLPRFRSPILIIEVRGTENLVETLVDLSQGVA